MTTSQQQTSPSGEDELTYSLADFLANHSVMPGSEKARKMTAEEAIAHNMINAAMKGDTKAAAYIQNIQTRAKLMKGKK